MVTDMFGVILDDLGKKIGVPLKPDENNTCLLKMKEGVSIQIEPDKSGDFLLLGCKLGVMPPGKYRENIFRQALKANDLPTVNTGIFSFSKKSDNLILFKKVYLKTLTAERLVQEVKPFVEKAALWANAIEHNDIPEISQVYTSKSGMFGL